MPTKPKCPSPNPETQEAFMRSTAVRGLALLLLVLALAAGGFAAAKTYQFTGVVKSADASTITVEKNAKETWVFETSKDTKGTAKVGDKVTVHYKMVATEIENKPAAKPAMKTR